MTAVVITPAAGGRASVRFRYDPAVVRLVKSTVPGYARLWSAQARCWYIDHDWTAVLTAELVGYGHTVTTPSSDADVSVTDTWAHQLFRAVGPQRAPAVHRALSKVLHPDNADTGCPLLQRQLNDARSEVQESAA